jgi:hypothetical protein
MDICDLEKHLHLIRNCCVNAKFDGIELWRDSSFWFWCCLCLVHGRKMVRLAYTIEG